jgi:RNA polymerase sigma-70 factor (ECF subfamily)
MGRTQWRLRSSQEDGDAFASVYREHHRNVWSMSFFYLKDHHEAEDAVQETFLKAWRGLERCRAGHVSHAWLLAICRNVCLDRLRRRPTGGAPESIDEGYIEICDPRRGGEDEDRRIDLRRAVANLGAQEREAWFLVDVLGFKSDEAAGIVGALAASTLRSRVARARRDLVAELTEEPPSPLEGILAADVRGLYHSSRGDAIVVSIAESHGQRMGRPDRRVKPPVAVAAGRGPVSTLRQSYLRLYAGLQAQETERATAVATAECPDLFEFLERLDRDVPPDRRVLALVETPSSASAQRAERWRAAHPRWRFHGTACHRAWQQAVEELLAGNSSGEQNHGARRMLALIDAAQPFVWTDDQNGFHR